MIAILLRIQEEEEGIGNITPLSVSVLENAIIDDTEVDQPQRFVPTGSLCAVKEYGHVVIAESVLKSKSQRLACF